MIVESCDARLRVGMAFGTGAFQTGVERYARCIIPAVRALGVDAEEVILKRREWEAFGRRFGGSTSILLDRARFRRGGRWDLLHALDPGAATKGTDVVTVHDILLETHPR